MIVTLILGLVFIIVGLISQRFPPRRINSMYGYRTNRSMADQASWDIAQRIAPKEMMKMGLGLSLIYPLDWLVMWSPGMSTLVGLALVILAVVIMIMRVEHKLKVVQWRQGDRETDG